MAKVITFSRTFPAYHPKKGQPTFFVEQFINWYYNNNEIPEAGMFDLLKSINIIDIEPFVDSLDHDVVGMYKYHTIRAGNRFKAGDYFSPRVWSGKPYNSKQIIIAPDTLIEKTFDFEIDGYNFIINGKLFYCQHKSQWHTHMEELCKNDGLNRHDLIAWFKYPEPFKGQIICWNKNINY